MPDDATKRCRVCGEVKPLNGGFYRRTDAPDGYRSDCQDCVLARTRRRYATKFPAVAEQKRKYQASHKEQVFAHYGEQCVCCGATSDLSIDHIDGDGKRHREELFGKSQGRAGDTFYWWLVKQGFPPGYQTLCRRCNISKGRGERCIFDHTKGESNLGPYLGRDAILKADSLRTEEVSVPEWGGTVLVRELRGRERDEFEASLAVQRGRQMVPDVENMRAKLAALAIVGEDLEPLFTRQDVAALGELSAAALDRVFEVASKLSGLNPADVEEMAKNSVTARSGDSAST